MILYNTIICSFFLALWLAYLLYRYIREDEIRCEDRVDRMSLCNPEPCKISREGSLMEKCKDCSKEWLWVIERGEPKAIYENEEIGKDFIKIIDFESEDQNGKI